eukprot:gene5758-6053_t
MSVLAAAPGAAAPLDPAKRQNLKRGEHWTCEEHQQFLRGLDELGRGSWRAISRFYVPSRTAAQVASHAQKFFLKNEGKSTDKSGKPTVLAPSTIGDRRVGDSTAPASLSSRGEHWTEDEHVQFLQGLMELGKGAWREISAKFVPSRTPTQVASHSQKYFTKVDTVSKRKRSLFAHDSVSNLRGLVSADAQSGDSNSQTSGTSSLPTPEPGTTSQTFVEVLSGESNLQVFCRERRSSYGTESKRACLEQIDEGLEHSYPMPLTHGATSFLTAWTSPLALPSSESAQAHAVSYWLEALQDLNKDGMAVARLPALACIPQVRFPSRSIDSSRTLENEACFSAKSGMPGMFRCTSHTSLDSLASDNSMSSGGVLRPYVQRASPSLPNRLQPALSFAPLPLGLSSPDDDHVKLEIGASFSIRSPGSLLCFRKSKNSAFHVVPPTGKSAVFA